MLFCIIHFLWLCIKCIFNIKLVPFCYLWRRRLSRDQRWRHRLTQIQRCLWEKQSYDRGPVYFQHMYACFIGYIILCYMTSRSAAIWLLECIFMYESQTIFSAHYFVETIYSLVWIFSLLDEGHVTENLLKWVFVIYPVSLLPSGGQYLCSTISIYVFIATV
jgi:hypothetical protein